MFHLNLQVYDQCSNYFGTLCILSLWLLLYNGLPRKFASSDSYSKPFHALMALLKKKLYSNRFANKCKIRYCNFLCIAYRFVVYLDTLFSLYPSFLSSSPLFLYLFLRLSACLFCEDFNDA